MNPILLHKALLAAFSYHELKRLLDLRIRRKIENITLGSDLKIVAAEVIAAAERDGWLAALVEAAHAEKPENEEMQAAYAALVKARGGVDVAPWQTRLLRGRRLLFDRHGLRKALPRLVDAAGISVLLVKGPAKSGKSHSEYMLHHVAEARGDFRVHAFALDEIPDTKPEELAFDIVSRIGGDPETLPTAGVASAARHVIRLVDWIGKEIQRLATTRWLFFDGCGNAAVPPPTRDLILQLMLRADGELRRWLRVIAVDYPGALPPRMQASVAEECIDPPGAKDLIDVIAEGAWRKGERVSDDAVRTAVQQIWNAHPEGCDSRLAKIASDLSKLLFDLGLVEDAP
jgi:hypothetical protein